MENNDITTATCREDSAFLSVGIDRTITAATGLEPLLGLDDRKTLCRKIDTIIDQPQIPAEAWRAPTGIRHTIDARCRHGNGNTVPMVIDLSVVHTSAGTQLWAQLREARLARRDEITRNLLSSLAARSTDAVIGTTLDGEIAFWNPAAQRMYGYHRHEVIGRPLSMLYAGDHQQDSARWMDKITRGQTVRIDDVPRRGKDGAVVHGIVTASPITGSAGAVIGAAVTRPDRTGDAPFRALLEAATIAIIGVGADGCIAMLNTRAEQMFGYRSDELINQPVDILVPEAFREHHRHLRAGYLADPRTLPMGTAVTLFAQRKDGTEVPVEVCFAPSSGDDLLIVASIRDLTSEVEHSRLEREIQHSRRLESIGRLAGGVAHGFNNLLGVIDGYSRFIQEQARQEARADPGSTYAAIADDAARVVEAGTRAATLARQLLAFDRDDDTEPRPLDLGTAVRDATELLRRSLGEHITIELHLTDDPQTIVADPGQVEQIIMNAAVNARDAMPTGGTITIDSSTITIDPAGAHQRGVAPGAYARLRISDTGAGIPATVRAKVFEPFYTTKPVGEGTGLGLSTIYGIVTGYRGHATIYSEPGHGTTLSLLLPLHRDSPALDHVPAPVSVTGPDGHRTVLVVDDEDGLRDLVERMLVSAGHHVLTAHDGTHALTVAQRYPGHIDLVLTDVIMPRMLGPQLAEQITALRPGTPVVFMSGHAQPALNARGTLGPRATLLEKPFTVDELHTIVDSALGAVPSPAVR